MIKKNLVLAALLMAGVIILSNFKMEKSGVFVMTTLGDGPSLPDNPFDYSTINVPDHLSLDTIMTGYEGEIDTISFESITDDKATLGRVLFYDEKLSSLENISCGSCHQQSLSFAENKEFSEGITALTKRNSMQLNDLGWTNNSAFTWGLEIRDIHEMIKLPLTDDNELGADLFDIRTKLADTDYYPALFEAAFGDQQINEERIIDALVQFLKSMTTFESKFDVEADNDFENFTDLEMQGRDLFLANCSLCHTQGSNNSLIGLPDIEVIEFFPELFNNGLALDPDDKGAGEWNENLVGLFKKPSLKNIELTAPYMHDGRFQTLDEVIEHYSTGIVDNGIPSFMPIGGFSFDDNTKEALKAFMLTLTDRSFITNEKWSNPFQLASTTENEIEDVVLRPNPMSESAIIEFSNPSNSLVSINVMSSDGKLLKHDSTTDNFYQMQKADYAGGIYFIHLIIGDKRSVQKLIVQ